MDYFEKLKQLPCEVVKESGRLTGNYALRISISGGNLEEIIDKAFSFFDNNFGKYKLIKY